MLVLFLFCAFRSGSDRFYLKRSAGMIADGADVFYYLKAKNIPELIRFYLSVYTLKLGLLAFCFAPFAAVLLFLLRLVSGENASASVFAVLLSLCAVLFVHGTVFFIRFNSLFFVSRYGFVSGRFNKLRQLLSFSFRCIDGNRRRVFIRKLSFVPWFFSCVFLLPISFVRSYYHQSMADIAADLMEKHLQKQ